MLKRQLFLILILISIILLLNQMEAVGVQAAFMVRNITFDLCLFFGYLFFLNVKNKYLFPSAIFIFFFYTYELLGKYVWVYRELNWFNESGHPESIATYYSTIGLVLIASSIISVILAKTSGTKVTSLETRSNFLIIEKKPLLISVALATIGAFIFTSGFTVIPFFSSSMDESRVALVSQDSGGRGIGFFLLLFGIFANSMALFSLDKKKGKEKTIYISCIVVVSLLLSLYSGRFLPMIPFVLYFIIRQHNQSFKFSKILKYSVTISIAFILLMYFGAVRQFGKDVTDDLIIRYLIADSFPEFRMTVYIHSMPEVNLFDQFFYTIFSGVLPGFVFSFFGINKTDYFQPIGLQILEMTQYDAANTPGIRMSLFGELSMTGGFVYVFVALICLILYRLDRSFFKVKTFGYLKYKKLSVAIFLGFAIPYGSLFLVSVIEWYIILYVAEKYFISGKLGHLKRSYSI